VEDVAPDGLLARLGSGGGDARTVGFSAPIEDGRGRVVGVWTSRFDFRVIQGGSDHLQDKLRARGSTARLLLASASGVVLYATAGSPAAGDQLPDDPVIKATLRPGAAGSVETEALGESGRTVLLGFHRPAGEGRVAELGWTVLASEDLAEATRPAANLIRRTVLIGLVIGAVMAPPSCRT
jgi:hypothetical protein